MHTVYEDSKRVKIQWLEEEKENVYKFAYVDWIEPQTIISTVKVKRTENNKLISIEEEDLNRIKALLDQAIKHGGIVVDGTSSSDEAASDKSTIGSDSEKEESKEPQRKRKKTSEKPKKKVRKTSPQPSTDVAAATVSGDVAVNGNKKPASATDPYTFDDDRSNSTVKSEKITTPLPTSENNTTATSKQPLSTSSITVTPTTNTKTKLPFSSPS